MPSPRSSTATASTWTSAGWRRAGTRAARTTSTARSTRSSTKPSSQALRDGEKTEFKEWEKDTPYFEGCMPIEVMAERGVETLRFGPMKGVGLDNPRTGRWPYAVVQLRQDNALGTLWNMVGFQTKLKHGEQVRIFRTIPGPRKCRVRAARRNPPQQLHQLAQASSTRASAEVEAEHPLRRPDHRLRRLCRERGDRPDRGPLRHCRAQRRDAPAASARDRAGRASRPYHRRCRRRKLPADERQFRPDAAVPGPRRRRRTGRSSTPTAPARSLPNGWSASASRSSPSSETRSSRSARSSAAAAP